MIKNTSADWQLKKKNAGGERVNCWKINTTTLQTAHMSWKHI